jgi:hypothetical protein
MSPAKTQRRKGRLLSAQGFALRLCAFAGVIFLSSNRSAQDSQLTTRSFCTQANDTVPLPATRVTNAQITPRRRAFPVTRHALTAIAASSQRRRFRCALICHTNISSNNPPLKNFPQASTNPSTSSFDHAQHMNRRRATAERLRGLSQFADQSRRRSIDPGKSRAHNGCYTCHTPASKSAAGREIASCGVCHDQKPIVQRPQMRALIVTRSATQITMHERRLACTDCHRLTAGAAQTRQVSSPAAAEHFVTTRSTTCLTCHNGRKSFGGDLAFKDCKRCHSGQPSACPCKCFKKFCALLWLNDLWLLSK